MINRLKKAGGSFWARSKAFRIIIITAFFLVMAVPIFLLTVYARIHLGISFSILLIIARLVFGYVARKEGYVEKAKELSPKYYYYARRVEVIVCGGLFTGFAILITLTVLFGPLPYPHSFLLFLTLIVVGAYIGDKMARKLRWY
jgi:membrane protein implicated in regulation of membrane protease activity